ncbi:MAG: DNA internalization-related competence protein ComEC/Rec2 [Clostridia bacterium]|nr:DNA internalization-related competence protein ComEC/Rec2 [Clostridia bacterium]
MNRKFVIITISYIIGLIWGLYFSKNIALIFCFILSIIGVVKKNKFILIIVLTIAISCLCNGKIKQNYDLKYNGVEDVKIIGTIVKENNVEEYSKKYTIKVESINGQKHFKNTQLLIYEKITKANSSNIISTNNSRAEYGDLVIITGTFEVARQNTNYKGYNYNEYLRSKKIYGTVKTETSKVKILKKDNINLYKQKLYQFYNLIKQKIYLILPENTASICSAIILGDKSNLDDTVIENFSESSLSHILAISGMHMTYIITILSTILKFCDKKKRKIIIIVVIILFCNLVGNSESIVRASIMVIINLLGSLLHRKSDSITNLSISALLILIVNPYAIKSMSFVLSFGGTLGIILFSNLIKDKMDYIKILNKNAITKYVKESIIISISANIIIIPILAIYYNKISFIFIISNIFANILLSIIMPLIFIFLFMSFISISITKTLSFILNLFFNLLLYLSSISAKIKILSFIVNTPYKITVVLYYIALITILIGIKIREKFAIKKILKEIISIYLVVSIILNLVNYIDSNMYIHFIDVGQGDSTLIITPSNKKILIDGGGSENGEDYVGKNILLPYLLDRRIKKLDYMIISHFDSDHVAGLFKILQELKVQQVIISKQIEDSENYQKFLKLVKEKKIVVKQVRTGDRILIEKNFFIDFIWPSEVQIAENALNNNSVVCKLNYNNFSMLFTGDIEKIAEEKILDEVNNNLLEADSLKVAHHGSKTSSIEEFIEAVKPKIALIGVGANNKYGHPNSDVISRLEELRYRSLQDR